jgi:hypothetical protein
MSVKLVAEFMGLMVVVPQGNLKPAQADVVMVNGTFSTCVSENEPHPPRLIIETENVWEGHPDSVIALSDGRRLALWKLDNSRVELVSDDAPGVEFDDEVSQEPGKHKPTISWMSHFWKDFGWIGNVSLAAHQGKINPAYLKDQTCDPRETPVAALVHLTAGELYTGIPRSSDLRSAVWEFKAGDDTPTHTRALSDRVCLKLRAQQSFKIRIKPFPNHRSYGKDKDREIEVRPASGRDTAKVSFSSMPTHLPSPGPTTRIKHFAAYYDLLAKPLDCKDRPIPTLPGSARGPQPASLSSSRAYPRGVGSSDCPLGGMTGP